MVNGINSNSIIRTITAISLLLTVTFSVAGLLFFILILFFDPIFLENGLSAIHIGTLSMLFGLVCGISITRMFWARSGKKDAKRIVYALAAVFNVIAIMLIIAVIYIFTLKN